MSTCSNLNLDLLNPVNFQFSIKRAPNLSAMVREIEVPGISLPFSTVNAPTVQLRLPGEHLQFDPISITAAVNSDLSSWKEVYDWLIAMGAPQSTTQYSTSPAQEPDATLTVLSNQARPILEVRFFNMFPIEIGAISFSTESQDAAYARFTASFAYVWYDIKVL